MTNTPLPQGSGGPLPNPTSAGPSIGTMRRSSYASVVSGNAAGASQNYNVPARSGAFSHLATTTPSSSYPPQYQSDYRSHRFQSGQDLDLASSGGNNISHQWRRSGTLPSYSRQFANSLDFGTFGTQTNQFFTPSYLRGSRYVAKLEAAHRAKATAQRESTSTHSSNPGSLSASSSNVNLHRMAPSHRGMTYDIVEHHPPTEDDGLNPLPAKWNEADKFTGLEIQADGLELRYMAQINKHEHEAGAARADHPIPPQCGIYYYEVTILNKSKEGMIAVGFAGSKASLERLPGWEQESWAYHGDDGKAFFGENQGQGKAYGPTFTVNDVIGCGVNYATGSIFFTKNGVFLGVAFRDIRNVKLFPSVGMKKQPGAHLRVNFGQSPFIFDIDGMMAKEKMNIEEDVNSTATPNLDAPFDETGLIQELVAQFLAHDGYVETARAFAQEVQAESTALQNRPSSIKQYTAEEDLDAINRQRIRAAILEGDIDKALKHTNAYYSSVLQDNPHILFRLRCRKFIEMIRRCSDIQSTPTPTSSDRRTAKSISSLNGHGQHLPPDTEDNDDPEPHPDVFEHEMELDDPDPVTHHSQSSENENEDWDKMDTEEVENGLKYQELLQETIQYGQELRLDYRDDTRREVKKALEDTFSLMAYDDPKSSVYGYLLEPSGRVPVAEELNSAILVSLGKSSSAALERLYQQTEALVSEISEDGGAGAFINVRNDFLV